MNVRNVLKSEYRRSFQSRDKLGRVARLIDWEAFGPALEPLFKDTGEGRPHFDVVLMMKVLVLQAWYGLSDEAVEAECKDRLTFQNFLSCSKASTILLPSFIGTGTRSQILVPFTGPLITGATPQPFRPSP